MSQPCEDCRVLLSDEECEQMLEYQGRVVCSLCLWNKNPQDWITMVEQIEESLRNKKYHNKKSLRAEGNSGS